MKYARIRTIAGPFLLIGVLLLIGAACEETTPERVDDRSDDAVEIADDNADDAAQADDEAAEAAVDDDADEVVDDATDEPADDTVDVPEDEATDDAVEDENGELEEAEGFTVGDTVRMGDLVMRLHAVRWDDGGEFMSPEEGMRWLIADVEIENEADSATNISSLLMFDLIDEDNRARDIAFMADTEGSLDGELGAGRSLRGDLAWEVRAEHTEWELIFSPNIFGFGQAIFDITADDF